MRGALLFLFGCGALWDVTTTIYGTWSIFDGKNIFALIASVVFGLVVLALLASTLWIWQKEGIFGTGFKIAWIVAILIDLWTSWNGNRELLFQDEVEGAQFLLLLVLTAFMSLSPIAWVYIQKQLNSEFL